MVAMGIEILSDNSQDERISGLFGFNQTGTFHNIGTGGQVSINLGTMWAYCYTASGIYDGTPNGQIDHYLEYRKLFGSSYTLADSRKNITLDDNQVYVSGGRALAWSVFQVRFNVDVTATWMFGWSS